MVQCEVKLKAVLEFFLPLLIPTPLTAKKWTIANEPRLNFDVWSQIPSEIGETSSVFDAFLERGILGNQCV